MTQSSATQRGSEQAAGRPVGSSSTSVNTPVFWELLWRTSGIQFVVFFIIAYVIYGNQPQVAASPDALVAFYTGDRTRILIAAVFSGLNVLNSMWFAAARDHSGGCGARRLGHSGDRRSTSGRRVVPPAHLGPRSPRILDRRLRKSLAHSGIERPRVGRRRVDFVPARDADHGRVVRALAGQADVECAVHSGGHSRRARLAGRHHLAERRILGTGRRLFAVRLTHHRPRLGRGREPDPLGP